MFECMDIAKNISEGVVEPSYKKSLDLMLIILVIAGNERIISLVKTYSHMGKLDGKRNQRYVDLPRDRSKLTCMIHEPRHYLEKCKILNEFITEHASGRPFK